MPGIDTYAFDFGLFTIAGAPGTDESPLAYAPRRTVLDKLLVDAASEAGAEVRQGFTVADVVIEEGRVTGIRGHWKGEPAVTEHARVVVGADGHHSLVARSVNPEQYNEKPPLQVSYYTYLSGLPQPFGPGWALVGDAGYTKDFITALGISDAFRDAELCATGLDEALSGTRPFEVAMADYQSERDRRSLPFYEFTAQLATLQPPPPELLLRAERTAPACSEQRSFTLSGGRPNLQPNGCS